MLQIFAHAEELHTESTNEFIHLITQWYTAIPLFFGLLGLIVFLLKDIAKLSIPVIINLVLGIFFLVGVLAFQLVPALSIICISLGILGALLIVLTSLSH